MKSQERTIFRCSRTTNSEVTILQNIPLFCFDFDLDFDYGPDTDPDY